MTTKNDIDLHGETLESYLSWHIPEEYRDNLEVFVNKLLSTQDRNSRQALIEQILDMAVDATYVQDGRTYRGLATPRNLVKKLSIDLQHQADSEKENV